MTPAKRMENRIKRLQQQLKRENPILVRVVDRYRELDVVAIKMGLLSAGESYATQISWWPLVSILGTFSAGKSSFINSYLDAALQDTGNQAVDDRFTVITYSPDSTQRTLPGIALDGDPRFPFYQISEEIENVSAGEGARIDSYLQMKAIPSDKLKGKIIIDSPGFDADEQRKSTLRITDHIIDLSDLVLVFFDARHPEPGAMQDTLEHLVRGSQRRNDSNKFVFILNQIDSSAKDDNLESIVASWQKALVQCGLGTGDFRVLFNDKLATPVEDENVWARYVAKRDIDYAKIMDRIDSISVERIYRIIGSMESLTNQIEQHAVPRLRVALQHWKNRVLLFDGILFTLIIASAIAISIGLGYWQGFLFAPPWMPFLIATPALAWSVVGGLVALFLGIHFYVRKKVAKKIASGLSNNETYGHLSQAFIKNTRWWRSLFHYNPVGWSRRVQHKLDGIRDSIDNFVQKLNDRFASPSGK